MVEQEALSESARACRIVPAALHEQIGDVAAICVALTRELGKSWTILLRWLHRDYSIRTRTTQEMLSEAGAHMNPQAFIDSARGMELNYSDD